MAKKKTAKNTGAFQTKSKDRPLFIELRRGEPTEAIRSSSDNIFVGPLRPDPNSTEGRSVKRVLVPRWKRYLQDQFTRLRAFPTGIGLIPTTQNAWLNLFKWTVKNDFGRDPAYAQYRCSIGNMTFWRRYTEEEIKRGLRPPLHPEPGEPGIDYPE